MMGWTVLFWAGVICLAFAFALAVQMRVMVALVLRKALEARFGSGDPLGDGAAVRAAAAGLTEEVRAAHLADVYPRPLSHLRLARRASVLAPALLLGLLLAQRLANGGD